MYSKESLEAMTVVELRQIARENGVKLSAGISKQGIVERLCDALVKEEEAPAPSPAPTAAAPVHRTASIISDDEDTPVLTPNAPFMRPSSEQPAVRPAAAAPAAPAAPTVNRGNVPGTNKPAFTLEGARAWHNPRTYQQQSGSSFAQRPAAGYGAQQRPTQPLPYGQQRVPQRPAPTVSRFGPDAVQTPEEPVEAPQETRPHYNAPYSAESRPAPAYNNGYQSDYRRREPASGSGMALPDLLASGEVMDDAGVLEVQNEGFGYLRTGNYLPGRNDIYVSPAQIRRFHLRTGDRVSGKVRPRRENETHAMLLYVTDVNGVDAEDIKEPVVFDTLTAVYPTKQILLSKKAPDNKILRTIDLLCPIGFGQRALITAPSRSGKTALITAIAESIHAQYPQAELLCLMLGERPEDITIARDTAPGEVIYAGFDEPMENHTRIAELTLERALRLAEQKKDVVLLVDSLTALCRAYSDCAPQNVRILSGGLAAGSLAKPKKLFGSARGLREGGSLTIIAIMLSGTGIPLDSAIEKEFRGTANMELYLEGADRIDYVNSNTRNAASMLSPEALSVTEKLHGLAAEKGNEEFGKYLCGLMEETKNNAELVQKLD